MPVLRRNILKVAELFEIVAHCRIYDVMPCSI